jgi:hypothetical protein
VPHDDPPDRVEDGAETIRRVFGHPISLNEVHAVAIGTSGFFFGLVYQTAPMDVQHIVTATATALVVYAVFGEPALQSLPHDAEEYATTVGLETIRCEPWWFITSFTGSFAAAFAVAPSAGL